MSPSPGSATPAATPGRARRRKAWPFVAISVVVALLLSVGVSAAAAGTGADQARKDLAAYFTGMQKVQAQVQAFLPATPAGQSAGQPAANLGAFAARIGTLPEADVLALQRALDQSGADWRSAPSTLLAALGRHTQSLATAKAGTAKTPVSGATCDPEGGTPLGYRDIAIAAGFALAAEVAYTESDILIPDTADVITAALVGVWAATEGTRLGLEISYEIESECYGARLEDFLYALGGGQNALFQPNVNLEDILTLLGGVDDTANEIRNSVNDVQSTTTTITNQATTALTRIDVLTTNLATANTTINQLKADLATANTTINQLRTQLTAANGKLDDLQVTIDAKFGALQATAAAQSAVDLKLAIEAALSKSTEAPLLAFQLPASLDGYLDNVRAIVRTSIDAVKLRYNVTTAEGYFAKAEQARTGGDYKLAYRNYALAYQSASSPLAPVATR